MEIVLNGQSRTVNASTVQELLEELDSAGQRVAVERNRELVPRHLWRGTPIEPGDQIELVQFVGGG